MPRVCASQESATSLTCTGVLFPYAPSLEAWPAIAAADDRSATLPLALPPSDADTPLLRLLVHACAQQGLSVSRTIAASSRLQAVLHAKI